MPRFWMSYIFFRFFVKRLRAINLPSISHHCNFSFSPSSQSFFILFCNKGALGSLKIASLTPIYHFDGFWKRRRVRNENILQPITLDIHLLTYSLMDFQCCRGRNLSFYGLFRFLFIALTNIYIAQTKSTSSRENIYGYGNNKI